MSAAAMGTFLAIHRAEAAEKAKLAAEAALAAEKAEQSEELSHLLSQDLPPELLAAEIERLMKELEEAEQVADAEAADENAEGEQSAEAGEGEAAEVAEGGEVAESIDGTALAQAGDAGQVPAGVDARTTMTDGAGTAGAESASAATAGQGAAAGAIGEMGAVTIGSMTIPVGFIAGASVAAAVAIANSGGGGGGGSGGGADLPTQLKTTTGLVVDGNVRDATIFYDLNGNGILDAGELYTKTRADGTYEMTGDPSKMTGKLVVLGDGFDVLTGQKVGMMTAPEGFAFVSPLTTLIAAAGGDAESQNAMLRKLGIDTDGLGMTPLEYLKTYDPIKAMTEGSPKEQALAEKAFTVSQQVFAVIQTAAELQAKVTGSSGAALQDITQIAKTIAETISAASTTSGSGAPVSTTSLINQAASKAVETALTAADPEVREALQANVTRALATVNEAIEEKYEGLAEALIEARQNPEDDTAITELAEKVAIAAVSQNTLISGVRAIDTTDASTVVNSQDALLVAANKEALEKLQTEVFVDAVKAGSDAATMQFLSLSSPQIGTASKFTIVDTQAKVLENLQKAYDPVSPDLELLEIFEKAIGVVVSDAINLTTAQDLINLYPRVVFRSSEVVYDGDSTMDYESVYWLIDAGYRFPADAHLKVNFTADQLDFFETTVHRGGQDIDVVIPGVVDFAAILKASGVESLSIVGGTLGPANGLSVFELFAIVDAGLKFDPANTIKAHIDHLDELLPKISQLAAANVDLITATDSPNEVSLANALTVINAGIKFEDSYVFEVQVAPSASDIALLVDNADKLFDNGIDHIVLSGSYALTFAQAQSIVDAGLKFVAGDIIVAVDDDEAASLPAASFFAAGMTSIFPIDGSIALASLAPILDAGLGLHNGGAVAVGVTSADSALLADHAGDLAAQGVTTLTVDAPADLSLAAVQAVIDNGMHLSGDVSLEMAAAELGYVVSHATEVVAVGVDSLNVVENALTLGVTDASALIDAGLAFSAPEDEITLDVEASGSGTQLHNSLKDLQKLGVDKVMLNGGDTGEITIGLGSGDPLELGGGLPVFEDNLDVALTLGGQGELNEILNASGMAASLDGSGIDELDMADNQATIDLNQASEITGTDLHFAAEDLVTLTIDESNLSDAAAIANDLVNIGVDYLSAGHALTIADPDAAALGGAGLTFDPDFDITLDAEASGSGTHLSSSLKDLQKLGVDKVMLNGGADGELSLGLGNGDPLSGSGLPVFEDGLDVSLSLLDQNQLNEVLDADGLASVLDVSGIDVLDMADNTATINLDQAGQFQGTDLTFAAEDTVTLTIDPGSVADAAAIADDLAHIGVDFLNAGQELTIADPHAAALGSAGLTFDPDFDITLDAEASGSGTHLSSSLKDLQKLGVDKVMLNGGADGELSLGLGSGDPLSGSGLPVFEDGLDVSLSLADQGQLEELLGEHGLVGTLDASHVDVLDMANNEATISMDQAAEFGGTDVTFAAEDIVTLTVDQSNVSDAASSAQDLAHIGVDYLTANGLALTIGENDASSLVQAGLEFYDTDMVTLEVTGADGTHLSTSLKDLQKLGVDKVMLGGVAAEAGTLTVDAGTGVDWAGGLPQFSPDDRITLSISSDEAEIALGNVDALKEAGIDTLFVDDAEQPIVINLDEVTQLIGADLQYVHGDLNFSADNDVTLEVNDAEFAVSLDHLTGLQGAGVDTFDMDDNSAVIVDGIAQDLLKAGLQFAEDDDQIVLNASLAEGTHLSTSLKDMQKLGVDMVSGTAGASVAVDLGNGMLGGSLPQFDDELNVTLSVNANQLGEVIGNAAALDGIGIDTLRLHGTADELNALDPDLAQAATVSEITLDTTGEDLLALLQGGIEPGELPSVGDLDVSRIDVIGASGTTGEFTIDLDAAASLVDAGLAFESMDNITLDITQGSSVGTALATDFETMHKLGVDKIQFNLDGAPGFQLDELPDFDDDLNVTLNVGNEDIGAVTPELASTLRDLGFDHFAFDENLGDLGSLASTLDELDPITDAGLGIGVNITGGMNQALDPALFAGMGVDLGDVPDLVAALTDSGVTQLNVKSDVEVTDELLNALADAGMLNALPEANLTLDATNSGDRLYTSLKEMADLDIDHVVANTSGNLYIDLGELGQGDALAEVKELLANLDPNMFTGADKPTLVLDQHTAEALSTGGIFDADIMAGLESIGIKEIGVLVGHNQHTNIVAQVDVPVEVKIIGQDLDPQLYDELYHPKQS